VLREVVAEPAPKIEPGAAMDAPAQATEPPKEEPPRPAGRSHLRLVK
jgi:hypothetical protein